MKVCPKCKSIYPEDKKFCKACGLELIVSSELAKPNDDYFYFGILALFIPIINLFNKLLYKIFLVSWGRDNIVQMVESIGFRLSYIFIFILTYSIPILIAIKIKNVKLKYSIILLSVLIFIGEALSQLSVSLNWNNFWYR